MWENLRLFWGLCISKESSSLMFHSWCNTNLYSITYLYRIRRSKIILETGKLYQKVRILICVFTLFIPICSKPLFFFKLMFRFGTCALFSPHQIQKVSSFLKENNDLLNNLFILYYIDFPIEIAYHELLEKRTRLE